MDTPVAAALRDAIRILDPNEFNNIVNNSILDDNQSESREEDIPSPYNYILPENIPKATPSTSATTPVYTSFASQNSTTPA